MSVCLEQNRYVALRSLTAAALMALTLAACETVGGGVQVRGPQFAELDDPQNANPNAASNNISSLSEVISRNPNDAGALNLRGAAYARAGRFSEAIRDFDRAIQLDPNLAAAFLNRGLASRQAGRNDAAMNDFNRASLSGAGKSVPYPGQS
jgi:tetratricopeptide (TPR) repeat protein